MRCKRSCCGGRIDKSVSSLIEMIKVFSSGGWIAENIFLFKTKLENRWLIMPCCWNREGKNPCIKILHHQGVVMRLKMNGQTEFLQMDFGDDGFQFYLEPTFPTISDKISWDDTHDFLEQDISRADGDLGRLVEVLEEFRCTAYDPVLWNCKHFSDRVWKKFVPVPSRSASFTYLFPENRRPQPIRRRRRSYPAFVERGVPGETDQLAQPTRRLLWEGRIRRAQNVRTQPAFRL